MHPFHLTHGTRIYMYAYMYLCVYYIILIFRHLTFTYLLVMNDGDEYEDEEFTLKREKDREAAIQRIMRVIVKKNKKQRRKPVVKKK